MCAGAGSPRTNSHSPRPVQSPVTEEAEAEMDIPSPPFSSCRDCILNRQSLQKKNCGTGKKIWIDSASTVGMSRTDTRKNGSGEKSGNWTQKNGKSIAETACEFLHPLRTTHPSRERRQLGQAAGAAAGPVQSPVTEEAEMDIPSPPFWSCREGILSRKSLQKNC